MRARMFVCAWEDTPSLSNPLIYAPLRPSPHPAARECDPQLTTDNLTTSWVLPRSSGPPPLNSTTTTIPKATPLRSLVGILPGLGPPPQVSATCQELPLVVLVCESLVEACDSGSRCNNSSCSYYHSFEHCPSFAFFLEIQSVQICTRIACKSAR